MAKDNEPIEELSAIAAQTIEKARGAWDNYFNFLQKSMSSYPWGGTDLGEKLKSFAEHNIAASHEFVRKLSQAKDLQDVIQIQTEFMQTQLSAFAEQAKNLGEAYTKAVMDAAAKTPFKMSP
jgi:hypothetical protein